MVYQVAAKKTNVVNSHSTLSDLISCFRKKSAITIIYLTGTYTLYTIILYNIGALSSPVLSNHPVIERRLFATLLFSGRVSYL